MTRKSKRGQSGYRLSRRAFVGTSATTTLGIAGCLGGDGSEDGDEQADGAGNTSTSGDEATGGVPSLPRVSDPPEAVYLPTHRNAMKMIPPIEAGDYRVSPMITYPHTFWLVTGTQREEVSVESSGVHLMMTIQDADTGMVLPIDKGAQVRVSQDGDLIDQRAPWPMISQRMGFHFGDNIGLPDTSTYTVEFDVNPLRGVRTTRAFEGRFERGETVTFEFTLDSETQQELVDGITYFDEERWGKRDALAPMEMGSNADAGDMSMSYSQVPEPSSYPGRAVGTPSSGDATFLVRYLEETELSDGDSGYLLVSPRTPYNRVPLPDMALSLAGALEGDLTQTLDSRIGHHYAFRGSVSPGDTLELVIDTPPQVARHRGYETAFLDMPNIELTIPE